MSWTIRGSNPGRYFSLFKFVQTGTGARPVCYWMAQRRDVDQSRPAITQVKNEYSQTSTPHVPSWYGEGYLEVLFVIFSSTVTPPLQLHLHHSTYSKPSLSHSLGLSPCLFHPVQISVTSIPLNIGTCSKLHGVTSHRPSLYGGTPFSACFINQNRNKIHKGLTALLSIVYPFILQSVLRQVHSHFHSKFSTQRDLLLPLSISSTLSFPSDYPVAAYIFFLILPSLIYFSSVFPSIMCFKWQLLRKM